MSQLILSQRNEAESQAHCFASKAFLEGIAAVKGTPTWTFEGSYHAEKRQPIF